VWVSKKTPCCRLQQNSILFPSYSFMITKWYGHVNKLLAFDPLLWCLNVHLPLVWPLLAQLLGTHITKHLVNRHTRIITRIFKTIGKGGVWILNLLKWIFFVTKIYTNQVQDGKNNTLHHMELVIQCGIYETFTFQTSTPCCIHNHNIVNQHEIHIIHSYRWPQLQDFSNAKLGTKYQKIH